jgi:hypothetical protein
MQLDLPALHIRNTDILKSVYFAYFHSLIKYGIIFWCNSSESKKGVYIAKKKKVRNMMGAKSHTTYTDLFMRLQILSSMSIYTGGGQNNGNTMKLRNRI